MLNSLANHGFLPHNGKNITLDDLVKGLSDGVNMDPGLAAFLFDFALTTNPEPNATVFSLDNLSRHNILEHDASLRSVYTITPFGHRSKGLELTQVPESEAVRMPSTGTPRSSTRRSLTRPSRTGQETSSTWTWPLPRAMPV